MLYCVSVCLQAVSAPVVSENPNHLSGYAPLFWWSCAPLSEILSGTLANDPIKTCITAELTRDYTLRSTWKKRATLSDTVE